MSRLIVVSNRVAVPDEGEEGQAGGLAVAVRSLLTHRDGLWFGWSGTVAGHADLESTAVTRGGISYVLTDLSEADYQEYYNGFANRVLWPILHYRLDLAEFSRRDLSGYRRVNVHFANQLNKLMRPDDVLWVHDYHLIPLARLLRDRGWANRIGIFLHVPFPPPDILAALPHHEWLIPQFASYDLVGFQTANDADNFTRYFASEGHPSPQVRYDTQQPDQPMQVGVFPIGIDAIEFNQQAQSSIHSPFVQGVLDSLAGRTLMIGVDRLDYSKGLAQRLDAFERFLATYPDWHSKVTYLQITPKSRSDIQEYVQMEQRIGEAAGRLNGAYGEAAWTPIRYVNRSYNRDVLAGLYRAARVGLVTPLRDGMNLVAKEYVAAQDANDPGVLILSRFAGAAAEMKAALLVNPYDAESITIAISHALSMPLAERQQRHEALFRCVCTGDIRSWGQGFLAALSKPSDATARNDARSTSSLSAN